MTQPLSASPEAPKSTGDPLLTACRSIDADYMTSEKHHPGYVLIPTATFEAIRDAVKFPPPASSGDGQGLREQEAAVNALRALGYQTVFNAIAAAVDWQPHNTFGISVEKFEKAISGDPL